MDVAAIIVATAALLMTALLAGFGILIQFQTHKATTEQAERTATSVAEFRADMHALLGELKGMTDRLVDAQQQQFNRMLEAFVTRPGTVAEAAEKATQSAVTAEEVGGMLEALREEVEKVASPGPMLERLEALERRLDDIRESSAAAARFAGAASRPTSAEDNPYLTALGGDDRVWVSIEPAAVKPGGRVTLRRLAPWSSVAAEGDCEVGTPDGRFLATPWPSSIPELVFPDHFPYGSTQLAGRYGVTVYRRLLFSMTGKGKKAVFRGSFYVRSGEGE